MHILVTGGAGFIGSHMCEKLHKKKITLSIVDNLFRGRYENISDIIEGNSHNKFYNIDIAASTSVELLSKIITKNKPDIIIHYAAINGTTYFYDIPYDVARINSIATLNILQALKIAMIGDNSINPFIIFASSSEVYCEPLSLPTSESDITYTRIEEKRDSYAAAKLMSEFYVKLFSEEFDLEWVILRIFNVYGPRMDSTKYGQVIPEFISRLKSGEYPLKIFGDGNHTRSFCNITDHIELTWKLINGAKRNNVYNLGNPDEISINDLATSIMKKMNLQPKFIYLKEREGDHKRRVPDINKLANNIGPHNFISLEKGIEMLL